MQKLFLLFGLAYFLGTNNISGMDTNQSLTKEKIILNPFKKLPYPKSVKNFGKNRKIFGGKNNGKDCEYYKEYVDIREKCPIAQMPFIQLIKNASEQKRPCIIAVTTTKGDDDGTLYRSYFCASFLCKWMFEEATFKRKSNESFSQHLIFKKYILYPIYFFAIDSLKDNFKYAGDEYLFRDFEESFLLRWNIEESFLLKCNIIAGLEDKKVFNDFCHIHKINDPIKDTLSEYAYKMAADCFGDCNAMNALGIYYYEQNKFELSEYYLKKAIKDCVSALNNLGYLYMCLDKYELAENYLKQAIEKKFLYSYYNLGRLYLRMDNLELAIKNLTIAADNGEKEAQDELLTLENNLKEKKIIDKIESISNGEELSEYGKFLYESGDIEHAQYVWNLAYEKYQSPAGCINIGICYHAKGEFKLAEESYLYVIEKYKKSESMQNLGNLYFENNELDRAEKYFLMAIENDEHDISLYNLGNLYFKQDRLDLAEKCYLCAIEKSKLACAMNNLGVVYKKQDKLDLAEKWFMDAAEKGDRDAYNNLGILYKQQNKLELAKKYFKKAAENGDEDAKKAHFNMLLDEIPDIEIEDE